MIPHLITAMVFLPILGAVVQAMLPATKTQQSKWISMASSLGAGLLGLVLVFSMSGNTPELQWVESLDWVGSYSISYEMGLDGMNALLVLFISILFPILIAYEWNRTQGVRGMHALFLILQAAFAGAVCAQDLFLLFFFWSLTAVPFYFLIGIWGGEKREAAAFRFVVSAVLGNALLFAAMVLVYYAVEPHSFLITDLAGGKLSGKTFPLFGQEWSVSSVAFALTCLGLALRAPIWPLHGWYTQVCQQAPSSVVVALSAVTLPTATYVLIRICYSLFPEVMAGSANGMVTVGAVSLLVSGLCAISQTRLRLLFAYICMGKVGLLLIGIGSLNTAGVVGTLYEQLAMGLGVTGFGLLMGLVSDRLKSDIFMGEGRAVGFGGVALSAPWITWVAGVVTASLLGIPGTAGFIGNALLSIGSYSVHPGAVILTGMSFLMAAYYLFTMYRMVFFGESGEKAQVDFNLGFREKIYFLPLLLSLLTLGIYPKPFLDIVRPTLITLLSTVK